VSPDLQADALEGMAVRCEGGCRSQLNRSDTLARHEWRTQWRLRLAWPRPLGKPLTRVRRGAGVDLEHGLARRSTVTRRAGG
jgi:hypothetical protein